ncbi:hypothetical protein ABW20_dc0102121 [Dactylellina cionopaga]|nr:hypothetical protein ABW20_dc0102121 [Dactylellina cionopaga]
MNADTSVRLDDLSDSVRNIFRLLDRTRSDLPEPKVGDTVSLALVSSSRTVVDNLQNCLGAAERVISDASTLAEKQSVRESAPAAPDYFSPAQRRRVQDWINAPTADAISESSSIASVKPASVDVRSTVSTHATSPIVDRFKPELSVHSEEKESEEDDVLSESSDIDSDFKTNLYFAGLQYFEQQDYTRAEKFFTKAVEASDKSKPADAHMLHVKFYLAQTLCKQRRWDEALTLLTALQLTPPTEDSLNWMEASILHELALVYLGKGATLKAKSHAKSASSKRRKIHGKKDSRFWESIGLLADICQKEGDPEAAEAYRRAFIPKASMNQYTFKHTVPEHNVDHKEVVVEPVPEINDIDDLEEEEETLSPLVSLSRSPSSSQPSTSISRSTSMVSRATTAPLTPLTQFSDFAPPRPAYRTNSDSYVPPLANTFELDSYDPVVDNADPGNAYRDSRNPYIKEFLEVFRKVGQYQMLGWKEKAAKIAIAYYKSFSDNGRYKLVSRYMDDIAWRCLERNITEGLSSLSSTGHGFSAVHFFALLGVPSIVCFLLDRKVDVSAKATQIFGYTQASGERKRGKLSGLARSLSRSSINSIGVLAAADWTPLHFAAAYSGDPDTIQLLIDRGGQLEEKAGKGYTPLLLATRKAALDMERFLDHSMDMAAIEILVAGGSKVDAVDDDGLGIDAHAHCMKTGELANFLFGLSVT